MALYACGYVSSPCITTLVIHSLQKRKSGDQVGGPGGSSGKCVSGIHYSQPTLDW